MISVYKTLTAHVWNSLSAFLNQILDLEDPSLTRHGARFHPYFSPNMQHGDQLVDCGEKWHAGRIVEAHKAQMLLNFMCGYKRDF